MTIRDVKKFTDNIWDWAILNGCFGKTKISMSDLDGAAERNGELLIVETKLPGIDVPFGQHLMFTNLCTKNKATVFVVWGKRNEPEKIRVYHEGEVHPDKECTLETLRRYVSRWFEWAERQPPVVAKTSTPFVPFKGKTVTQ